LKQPTINVGGKEYPQQWFSWAEVKKMLADAEWLAQLEALEFVDRSNESE
jgi:hypothetical protein